MIRPLACTAAIALFAAVVGVAHAQTTTSVDLRIVEQTGQTQVVYANGSSPDAVLDFAVQIRVNGGSALSGFGFDMAILGEPDTNGTLALLLTSNADHTYAGLPPVPNASVGRGGLASTYSYLAAINNSFNGKINVSSGQFIHNPANSEIGLVTGTAIGSTLFATPGLDPLEEARPNTWPGYGTAAVPAVGATAPLSATVGPVYLAQGQFVDVYRFRYTVTNLSTRTLHVSLSNLRFQTAPRFIYSSSQGWGLDQATWAGTVNFTELQIPILPAPQGTCCSATTGACTFVVQTSCVTPAAWTSGGACLPSPCAQPGVCCDLAGTCSIVLQTACVSGSTFTQSGACQPNPCPQPGTCCSPTGVCSSVLQTACASGSVWTSGGTCQPNPCPQPGTCCAAAGTCTTGFQVACAPGSVWTSGGSCQPNPCAQPGTCCAAAGTCTFVLAANCASGSTWTLAGTCQPNPCAQPGICCAPAGACTVTLQSACASGSAWTQAGACQPNPCPQPGSCCATAGTCTSLPQASCVAPSTWTLGAACLPNPCPQPGSCCDATGTCTLALEASCAAPSAWTAGGVCQPNTCPQPGTCCDTANACTFVLQSTCAAPSTWTLGGTCNPTPCNPPGACCRGSICQLTPQAECTGQFARFTSPGLACNTVSNTTPCCKADFNGQGLAVQDIFDFLNAWLANDVRANFNGDDLAVQDIFDFLNAWLAGCS